MFNEEKPIIRNTWQLTLKDCVVQINNSYLYLLKRRNLIAMCFCMLDHKTRSMEREIERERERSYVTINVYLIISLIECFDIGLVEIFLWKLLYTHFMGADNKRKKVDDKKKYVIYHDKRYDF